ncbi:MAG: hypothetical protein LBH46_03120 [Rickettsiales bacterium]|jgi:hypothetical protein|nr:hypothetical protein [Rickettsiales bacterium]
MKFLFFLLFVLVSCNTLDKDYVCGDDSFNLELRTDLNKIERRKATNKIVDAIKYNKDSNKTLVVSLKMYQTGSLLSDSNVSSLVNVNLDVIYTVIDNKSDNVVYNGQIRLVNPANLLNINRYTNIVEYDFSQDNLFNELSNQLRDRISIFLNSCLKK